MCEMEAEILLLLYDRTAEQSVDLLFHLRRKFVVTDNAIFFVRRICLSFEG